MITETQLSKIVPLNRNISGLAKSINTILPKYDINTPVRISGFLAQCAVESGQFNILIENLNYSSEGLVKTFRKYFPTIESTITYAHNPERIANKVYANRMGNGSELSGEGWKYRGRGAIQTTGKDNYSKLSIYLNKGLDEAVNYCNTLDGAIESACFYWKNNRINIYADAKNINAMTYAVNGGYNGLSERTAFWQRSLLILGA